MPSLAGSRSRRRPVRAGANPWTIVGWILLGALLLLGALVLLFFLGFLGLLVGAG